MTTEQSEKQLEKWRKQERANKVIVACAFGLISVLAVAGVTALLVYLFSPAPTLTPTTLLREFKAREGRVVRVEGRAQLTVAGQLRVTDDLGASIPCQFPEPVQGVNDGDPVTVQGRVSLSVGLKDCRLVQD
jgi:hypothetical protein